MLRKLATTAAVVLIIFKLHAQEEKIDSIWSALENQDWQDQVISLNELAWIYKNFDIDSSKLLASSALEIANKENWLPGISTSYNHLANAFEALGQMDSAQFYHLAALKIKTDLQDTLGMAASHNNLGIIFDEIGGYSASLGHYFKSLEYYEIASDDPFDVAMVLGNIGIVYKRQNEFEKTLEYYERALKIYEEVESNFGIMVTKGNIGSILTQLGQFEKGIAYSQEALSMYEEAGYLRYVAYMQHNIAEAKDSLGLYKEASALYEKAAEGHRTHKNQLELAHVLAGQARVFNKLRQYEGAITKSKESLVIAEETKANSIMIKAQRTLADAYAGLGQYKEAYRHQEAYANIKDVVYEENKTRQIFELETQYETEKKEQMIKLQSAEIVQKDLLLERDQYVAIVLSMTIILVIVLGVFWYKRQQYLQEVKWQKELSQAKQDQINAVIQSQERERNRFARDLHDTFGQLISILNLNINSLKEKKDLKVEDRHETYEASKGVLDDMYKELKNVCFDLMPQSLLKNGLVAALDEFANRINQTGKIGVGVDVFGFDHRLSELQEISYYRITQEWVNNIIKYSSADQITIQLTKDDQEITLLVEDNGMGFDSSLLTNGTGNGWKNIQSRSNLIHGTTELDSQPNRRGNTLILNSPVKLKQQATNTQPTV
ncbi:MAG: tetratricopeptide repeat protein [Cyclobacteriaceae bacterium]